MSKLRSGRADGASDRDIFLLGRSGADGSISPRASCPDPALSLYSCRWTLRLACGADQGKLLGGTKCHVRAPSFADLQAMGLLSGGRLPAGIAAVIGLLDGGCGEID